MKDRGCREMLSSPLCHRGSSDAVELPLPLKARWYDPAMCQGYLNERGMTVASPDSWQEPRRRGRGEWMLRLHQLCLLYVCGTDWFTRQCVRVTEWVRNEWQTCFAGDVCLFRKCSFVFATRSFCHSSFILSAFSDLFWEISSNSLHVCFHLRCLFPSMPFHSVSLHL